MQTPNGSKIIKREVFLRPEVGGRKAFLLLPVSNLKDGARQAKSMDLLVPSTFLSATLPIEVGPMGEGIPL